MATITEDIKALRDIPAKWKGLYDPLDDLRRIRQGDEQLESSSHFYECTVCGQHSHCSTYTKLIVQEQLADALNTAADKDRQIAVLTERVDKLRDIITKAIKLTHETWTCRGLSEVLLADTKALADDDKENL